MMTGNGVMHNGTTTVDDYGQNLDKLKVKMISDQILFKEATVGNKKTQSLDNKLSLRMDKQLRHIQVGDRVAVVRKESGVLHFFVNSEDQVRSSLSIAQNIYSGKLSLNLIH